MVNEPLMDGVQTKTLGLVLKTQKIPRGSAQTDVRSVPGRAYADLTARPNGYARRGPMKAELVFWAGPGEALAEAGVRNAMAWDGKEVEYTPPDFGMISYRGVAAVEVSSRTVNVAEVKVTITADPVGYGLTEFATLAAGTNALAVSGTHPARPKITLTATSGVPSVKLQDTGEELALVSAPGAGAAVVVDCESRTVTVNGQKSRVTLSSDFFELEPGDRTIVVANASGSIEYRERYV